MKNYISKEQFKKVVDEIPNSSYKKYLLKVYNDKKLYKEYQK